MVTELVEGETLTAAKRSSPRCNTFRRRAQSPTLSAAAHETGITHRDLKPENVCSRRMADQDAGFRPGQSGHARRWRNKRENRITLHQPRDNGKPGNMSPKQVRGQQSDHRSDIFSLGVMLYELLARKPAFQGASVSGGDARRRGRASAELPESVPDGLRRIIKHCLEKKPTQRFQSARDRPFALRSFRRTKRLPRPLRWRHPRRSRAPSGPCSGL